MSIYCVYLTTYSGNKLPPFYIGYCRTERIFKEKYRGSVQSKKYESVWKEELKNFPEKFKIKILFYFNTQKEAKEKEEKLQMLLDVIRNPMYINLSRGGKYFYSRGPSTPEGKKKISQSNKTRIVSLDTRNKMSSSKKGISPSEKNRKITAERNKKKCLIDNIQYSSIKEAADRLNLKAPTVQARIHSKSTIFNSWTFI